jgi:cytochrome P450
MINSLVIILLPPAILGYFVFFYFLDPLFDPLHREVPDAHISCTFSQFWILYIRYTGRENRTIHAAHARLGPIVRLAPNEISVASIDGGVRTVYGGGFAKHRWYDQMRNFGDVPNMFSTLENREHSLRKRGISHVYAKSVLQGSKTLEGISKVLVARMLNKVEKLVESGSGSGGQGTVDLMAVMSAATMDFVTAYLFGLQNCSEFLDNDDKLAWWLDVFHRRRPFGFLDAELPGLKKWLAWFGVNLAPGHVAQANKEIGDWVMGMCDRADADIARGESELKPEDIPVVWRQLRKPAAGDKESVDNEGYDDKLVAASEMWDHLSAGQETSAITLIYVFHELTKHQDVQTALRKEVQGLKPSLVFSSSQPSSIPAAKDIDALPILDAVLMETLRLHAPIPGPQPRVTPEKGCTLANKDIPGGLRVSSLPYTLHRDANVFPDPGTWLPKRWLATITKTGASVVKDASRDEHLKQMHRTFWAFSSGARMCLGNHLATQEMKLIIAAVLSNFELLDVANAEVDAGMVQEDAWTAQPIGGELFLKMRRLPASA